jgi:integrase
MKLTDTAVRNTKPKAKPYKLFDGGGLYLLVQPSGARWWRYKYRRTDGKENTLSLGTYPDTSLRDAREKLAEARKQRAVGIDPSAARQAAKAAGAERAANSFETVAREWYAKQAKKWAASTAEKTMARLEDGLFPWIGARPVADITTQEVLRALRRVEVRTVDTAHRTRQDAERVFRYAIQTGRADKNPATELKGALEPRAKNHFASITDPAKVGELLRAIHGYNGQPTTAAALKLAPLLFVRPGELQAMEWAEVDLDKAEWNIPAERMKMRAPHLVPLSSQAVAILRELHPLTKRGALVFPGLSNAGRPISENTINAALRRLGYSNKEMTAHGFRAMARTLLDEVLHFRPDYIEQQLAHKTRDPLGRAYNRTAHLAERRKMMQAWAEYLDTLRSGANVVPFQRKTA